MSLRVLMLCSVGVVASCGAVDDAGSPSSSVVLAAMHQWEAAHRGLTSAVEAATEAELARAEGLTLDLGDGKVEVPPDIQELADSWIRAYASLPHGYGIEDGNGEGEYYALLSPAYGEKLRSLEANLEAVFGFQPDDGPAVKAQAIRARTLSLAEDFDELRTLSREEELPVAARPEGAEDKVARFERLCSDGTRAFAQSSAHERHVRAEVRLKVEQARASLLAAETELEALLLRVSPAVASAHLASGAVPSPAAAAADLAELKAKRGAAPGEAPSAKAGTAAELATTAELTAGLRAARDVWDLERSALDKEKIACGTIECEVLLFDAPMGQRPVEELDAWPVQEREDSGPSNLGHSSLTGEERRLYLQKLQRENESALLREAKAEYIDTKRRILWALEGDPIPRVMRSILTPRGRLLGQDLRWVVGVHLGLAELHGGCMDALETAILEHGRRERVQVEHRTKEFQVRIAAMLQGSARAAE